MTNTMPRATHEVATMRAVRLHEAIGPAGLRLDQVPVPVPGPGEALVRVHSAALTRDELDWPVDRLPAIPSYELCGLVAAIGAGVDPALAGAAVFALTPFDRDGVAADYATVPAGLLAAKPAALDDTHAAAIALPGLSAWQMLFDHGGMDKGQRVLILGATGGVGQFATQLARLHGAFVIGTASAAAHDLAAAARRAPGPRSVRRDGAGHSRARRPPRRHRGRRPCPARRFPAARRRTPRLDRCGTAGAR